MKSVTELKSLGDVRTASSHHIASKPPLKGSTYLELYLLDRERQRLEKEVSLLGVRQKRIRDRLGEIQEASGKLGRAAQRQEVVQAAPGQQVSSIQPSGRQWKKMPVEY